MHIKRLALPKTWQIPRKEIRFATRPSAYLKKSLPINIIFRDILHYASTSREVKTILNKKEILVDGVRRKDIHFPVSLMSVLSIKETGENFRMLVNSKGKLFLRKIGKEEAELRPCKVTNKTALKGGKLQINLSNGMNIIANGYETNDTLFLKLPGNEVAVHIKFEKGALVYFSGGSMVGKTGVIDEIKGKTLLVKSGGKSTETFSKFAIAIGKEKPLISIDAI